MLAMKTRSHGKGETNRDIRQERKRMIIEERGGMPKMAVGGLAKKKY